jgi:glycosyltransferase involved in cell wall biosynthesis
MKVMYVCTTGGSGRRQLGGAERILVELIPAIAERGVDVVACVSDDEVAHSLRESGIEWINMGARSRIDLGYARAIGAAVKSFAPDIVCSHLLSAAMHARAALMFKRQRPQLLVTLHNSLWQYREAAGSLGERASIQANIAIDAGLRRLRPHATVAVSQYEMDELTSHGWGDIHLIPNSLPVSWPASPPTAGTRETGPIRVGFLGRHEWGKGADLLPAIAAALPQARFLVAGAGSIPLESRDNIQLAGRVDAVEFLGQIDCLVVPSRVESFGLSALEAIAMGVPVVHSGVGGLAEVTQAADRVLAFQSPLEPGAFASAITTAVAATPTGQRQAVAERYAKEYAFTPFVDRWHELYRTLARAH